MDRGRSSERSPQGDCFVKMSDKERSTAGALQHRRDLRSAKAIGIRLHHGAAYGGSETRAQVKVVVPDGAKIHGQSRAAAPGCAAAFG
jgi:hypothetical protein